MFLRILYVCLLFFVLECSQKKFHKNFYDSNLFFDGFKNVSGLKFFDLLDPYPTLRTAMKSVPVDQFNRRLNLALNEIHPRDINGSLRAIQFVLLDATDTVQSSLQTIASLLNRFRTGDPNSFEILVKYLEKLRTYPKAIIRGILPISAEYLMQEYRTKNSQTLKQNVNSFINELRSENVKNLLTKTEDILHKALFENNNVRIGVETLLRGVVDSSIIQDKTFRESLVQIIYSLGDMMNAKAGFSDFKAPESLFKELIVLLEKHNTVGGTNHTIEYSNPNYSSEIETLLRDLFVEIKKLIVLPAGLTKDTVSQTDPGLPLILAGDLAVNINKLGFVGNLTNVEISLRNLLRYDFKGLDRSYLNNGSSSISSLESLFFLLSVVDAYGYNWENTISCNNNAGCTNHITSATGGIMTIGDTLWSLQSKIRSTDIVNFKNILNLSANSGNVYKDNIQLSGTRKVDINTPVLRLLELESLGETKSITNATSDPIYTKTIPWVMNWFKKVIYEGYGPYYNKNRKDAFGNFLTPSGSIYYPDTNHPQAKYKATWKTSDYKICLTKSGGHRWIGLGGRESDGTVVPHPGGACSSNPVPPNTTLWTYTIQEIPKTDAERAVNSDEEAFYKNFQWLLYEKRFVVVIPARAKLDPALTYEEALFIVAIGNGLKGMMGLRPNCGPNNSSTTDCGIYNGVWNSDKSSTPTLKIKSYDSANSDLSTFSSVPGDSVLLLEGWGYGIDGTGSFQKSWVFPTTVYNLLIPNPSEVYGLIPPVISQHFDVLERLGFFTNQIVSPSQTETYWENRNKLTPLVMALAKTLDDQVDVANNKNPHTLLVNLSKILARPYILDEEDPVSKDNTITLPALTTGPMIPSVRIDGSSSITGIRSPAMTSQEYLPKPSLRSLISLLSERDRKYQDGIINLLSKTNILTNLFKLLHAIGDPSKQNARKQILYGLFLIANEIKVDSDFPATHQYNLQSYFKELKDKIATYPDTRSTNLNSPDWAGVEDSVAFFRDYFSSSSPYSLTKSVDFALEMLSEIPPSNNEIQAFLNVVGSMLVNNDNSRNYRITNLLTNDLPNILEKVSPYTRNIYALLGSLGKPGSYINYLEQNMSFLPYGVKDLLIDLENIALSEMIQRKIRDEHALLYSAGQLLRLFADIHEFGRKFEPYGFPFADNLNLDDTSGEANYWNRLNMILSSKK